MTQPTVLLVHGAFADASSWRNVHDQLRGAGLTVLAPANPLRTIAGDAAYTSVLLSQLDGPVLLVGHSYGVPSSPWPGRPRTSSASSTSRPSPPTRART